MAITIKALHFGPQAPHSLPEHNALLSGPFSIHIHWYLEFSAPKLLSHKHHGAQTVFSSCKKWIQQFLHSKGLIQKSASKTSNESLMNIKRKYNLYRRMIKQYPEGWQKWTCVDVQRRILFAWGLHIWVRIWCPSIQHYNMGGGGLWQPNNKRYAKPKYHFWLLHKNWSNLPQQKALKHMTTYHKWNNAPAFPCMWGEIVKMGLLVKLNKYLNWRQGGLRVQLIPLALHCPQMMHQVIYN